MRYYSFKTYLQNRYGANVKKIGLNAGFGCTNRDPARGKEGCIFCNEEGFSNFYGSDLSLESQIKESVATAKEKHNVHKFIAYFLNGTSTNAPVQELKRTYDVIKKFPEIVGLSISTRPDCIDEEKLDLIAGYAKSYEVWIEYGVQTIDDNVLLKMNRGHTFMTSEEAIKRTAEKGIKVGVHIIVGAFNQSRENIIKTAEVISRLPVSGVKLHAFQVLKNTSLEKMYERGDVHLFTKDEYVRHVCDFLERLRADCTVLRLISDAKKDLVVAPQWMEDKLDVMRCIERELEKRGTGQGEKRLKNADITQL